MNIMVIAMLLFALATMCVPAQAQNYSTVERETTVNYPNRTERTVVYEQRTPVLDRIGNAAGQIAPPLIGLAQTIHTNRTTERINDRQMKTVDHQIDANRDIAMAQIGAQIAIAKEQADTARYGYETQARIAEAQARAAAQRAQVETSGREGRGPLIR